MISGRCPTMPPAGKPSAPITTSMPTSCSAIYGMVATIPVNATASAKQPAAEAVAHEVGRRHVTAA